ncbi:MAG: P27 family phage terminase small subunit [Ruminococcus sp.]|nr:P27 family phage terminase small subunit [Ruminococcus sp.]
MPSAKSVKDSLLGQLRERGADIELNRGLIDDYVFYFQQEKKMQADVRKNGIVIDSVSSTGKPYKRENPSVKLAMLYNKQKLAILNKLELAPSTVIDPDDSDVNADL